MTRRCIGSSTPSACSICLPEASKGSVTIDVNDNDVATTAVLSQTMLVCKPSSTPAVAGFNPAFKPVNILGNIQPTLSYLLRIGLVLAALVDCYLQLHYYLRLRGTVVLV